MQFISWLQNVGRNPRRPRSDRPAVAAECLEHRTLLSVASLFVSGELFVTSDGGDSISVRQNANGRVEILANGSVLGTAPNVLTSAVTSIVVKGGDEANNIDLNAVTDTTYPNLASITVDGGNGNDVIVGSPFYGDSILAGDGTDSLTGQGGNDTLDGGDGNDTLLGQDGDDSLIGEDGSDSLSGDVGNDTISGGDHPDTISGGDGNDVVDAGLSGDLVNGDNGNDTLNGVDGTDTISGDAGDDSILGGAGNDSLLGDDGNDTINGQGGADSLEGGADSDSLNGGAGNDLVLGQEENDFLNGGAGDDLMEGGNGSDTLLGGAGQDRMWGDQADTTIPSFGNDVLRGQAGNDTLDAGIGNDHLDGGIGDDLLGVGQAVPTPSLSIDDVTLSPEGDFGFSNVTFTVSLTSAVPYVVTVDYGTADGTAISGTDYDGLNGTLTFAPRQTSRTISIPVRGDVFDEFDETFSVTLASATGALLGDAQGIGTIVDNDVSGALPQLTVSDVVINPEGDPPPPFVPSDFPIIDQPLDMEVGDLDNDGDVDIVTAHRGTAGTGHISVLLNNGDGTFAPTVNYLMTFDCFGIAIGDLNGDNFADLVTVQTSTFGLAVRFNDGFGGFGPFIPALSALLPRTGGAVDVLAVDLDNDGDRDLANTSGPGVFVNLNNGNGTFGAESSFPALFNGTGPTDIVSGDFNGDGFQDVVTGRSLLVNNGNGTFAAPVAIPIGSAAEKFAVGDVDGDNDVDLIASNPANDEIEVLLNVGGTLGSPSVFATDAMQSGVTRTIALADMDNDGDLDALTPSFSQDSFSVLTNDGSGGFGNRTNFGAVGAVAVAVADFDGDGDQDPAVVRAIFNEVVTVYLSNFVPLPGSIPTASFTVSLSSPSAVPVSVDVMTADGSAVLNNDYELTSTTLTFAPGTQSQTIVVTTIPDDLDEPDENFFVNLSNPINATIADAQGHATVVDDDGVGPAVSSISISDVTMVVEGNAGTTNATFTVTLSPASSNTVTVAVDTADETATAGLDYQAITGGLLTFAAGVTSLTISVPVNGDLLVESDESFVVNLSNPANALLADSQGRATITDDDGGPPTPILTVADVTVLSEGDTGSRAAIFTLSLNRPSQGGAQVDFATVDGTAFAGADYQSSSGTVVFPAGSTSQFISVPILGDLRDEFPEFFTLSLTNAVNVVVSGGVPQAIILDDDGVAASTPDDDTLTGHDGNDTLISGSGNDLASGGAGNDLILGNEGSDTILGGTGQDTMNGGAGNDSLNGQGGADLVNSGTGDDLLVWEGAVGGKDTLSNESGADGVLGSLNGTNNTVTVAETPIPLAGTFGFMTVTDSGVSMTIDSSIDHVTIDGGNGDDTITVADLDKVNRTFLTIRGGVGNDLVTALGANTGLVRIRMEGGDGDDTLIGGLKSDTLVGGAGIDRLRGGDGNDQLIGGASLDSISGEAGNDTLIGGDGSDTLVGDGSDTLDGGDGNDSIRGDQGNDSIFGGLGNDTARGNDGNDTISGDEGDDSLLGDTALDSISGGNGNDTIDGGRNDDILNGGAGNDKIRGDHGNDTILGGAGNDTINGGDGDDAIGGQTGNDLMTGADGQDTVNGGVGNDIITGGDGDDSLLGSDGNDIVLGDQGDDLINGQIATDTLAGGQGDDTIVAAAAGEIDETFVLSAAMLLALSAQ